MLCQEKSKETWLQQGDQNSKYFHLSTIIRRRFNHIDSILNQHQEAVIDFKGIGSIFEDYSKDLFSSVDPNFPPDFKELYPTPYLNLTMRGLDDIPIGDEIEKAVFSMSNGKSPGPNRLSQLFFKF